jgi:hypothetical protein
MLVGVIGTLINTKSSLGPYLKYFELEAKNVIKKHNKKTFKLKHIRIFANCFININLN